jgi:hypothetical protein
MQSFDSADLSRSVQGSEKQSKNTNNNPIQDKLEKETTTKRL